ncbi:MAG: N-acetyltransferase [Tannerella sp.]|jgi:GNAT superfamily N-acetyltransferase|nr:N-acetyltransferase [Tannerella sp.]
MINLQTYCKFFIVSQDCLISDFDCGNEELNDFFNHKALSFKEQLLAMTCFFRHNESGKIVCAFSLSPNALRTTDLPNNRRKKVREYVPHEKNLQSYPAFLIGRLGVSQSFNGQGIGTQLINYIKGFCISNYTDFCRFLLIDAYNIHSVLNFYQKSNFSFVFSTEEQERIAYRIDGTKPLETRYLFYDMIHWKNEGA